MKAFSLSFYVLVMAGATIVMRASDSTAVYARIDKVVLEPASGASDRVQVWGVFSIARANWTARSYKPGDDYQPVVRGYLYFRLAGNPEAARREWADLGDVAGTGQVVSFGSRYQFVATVRQPDVRPVNPDPYPVNFGVVKVRDTTAYPPVQDLVAFKE